jgi:hypothetical protein
MVSRKQINEAEIVAWLQKRDWSLPPLTVEEVTTSREARATGIDARVTFGWRGQQFRFGAKVRRLWTPKAVTEVVEAVSRNAAAKKLSPLVVVPFLGEERLGELEARGVSGIDLCGNGVVVVPGKLLVMRSGSPNRFRGDGQIKNVYRGTSSLAARVFLLKGEFASVGEALQEIQTWGGEVTLPTVSKVCKRLAEDLVIERTRKDSSRVRKLRLLQAEKLLDLLRDNYTPPRITRTLTGKFSGTAEALSKRLRAWRVDVAQKVVLTGASSVDAYAVMAREPMKSYYASDVASLTQALGAELTETERFANVKFLETSENFVYFDSRDGLTSSPVQTYLELAAGEKREQETAEQVRRFILQQPLAKERKERTEWTS